MMDVSIVGSGVMASGLVQLFAESPSISVVNWLVRNSDQCYQKLANVKNRWYSSVKKGKLQLTDAKLFEEKIRISTDFSYCKSSAFIIEAVVEDIDVKKSVFHKLSQYARDDAILATNTSSLSITEISLSVKNKSKVIGMHFFNPAPVMMLNEIVSGMLTDNITKDFVIGLSKSLGKNPIEVKEAPGFVVNRMLIPLINEAICIYAEGIASPIDIDAAMCMGANHPIGPLSLADLIGNDICLNIMDVLFKETGDSKYRAHPLLRKFVRAGYLGRKSGIGFFEYM